MLIDSVNVALSVSFTVIIGINRVILSFSHFMCSHFVRSHLTRGGKLSRTKQGVHLLCPSPPLLRSRILDIHRLSLTLTTSALEAGEGLYELVGLVWRDALFQQACGHRDRVISNQPINVEALAER